MILFLTSHIGGSYKKDGIRIPTRFISEAMGAIKPTLDYYTIIMKKLNCNPKECLMIGDSITNDIVGAKNIGMEVEIIVNFLDLWSVTGNGYRKSKSIV